MKFQNIYTLLGLISFTTDIMAQCLSQEVMDSCIKTHSEAIQTQCRKSGLEDYVCLCNNLPNLMGCYDNCPSDLSAMGRKGQLDAERNSYCQVSKSNNGANGPVNLNLNAIGGLSPTPTVNSGNSGLFTVSSSGTQVKIDAGPTHIIVPVRGNELNTNTPVIGSVYSQYTLGSLSVGYKTNALPTSAYSSAFANNGTVTSSATKKSLGLVATLPLIILLSNY